MHFRVRQAAMGCLVIAAACFGIFVLPFLFPPADFQGVSASAAAGFNNKLCAVVAACISVCVFAYSLWRGDLQTAFKIKRESLPGWLVTATICFVAIYTSVACLLVYIYKVPFESDAGYFVHQMTMHSVFGRQLYSQIEMPYGPLLFYGPLYVQALLTGLHISLRAAYFVTLTCESTLGTLLAVYVIQALDMSKSWKLLLVVLGLLGAFPINMGVNYTFFRFMPTFALLVLLTEPRRKLPAAVAIALLGELLCLSITPEAGLAFLLACVSYGIYRAYQGQRGWMAVLLAAPLSGILFLVLAVPAYLKMLKLFARGLLNLPVEPLPVAVVFLVAVLWIVPRTIARYFVTREAGAPRLAVLYIASLALLPVAFGRADSWHIFWNGFVILCISGVGATTMTKSGRGVWAAALCMLVVWTLYTNVQLSRGSWGPVGKITWAKLHHGPHGFREPLTRGQLALTNDDNSFNLSQLQQIVGHDRVATPFIVPIPVQDQLLQAGQLSPSYFAWQTAVLDISTEKAHVEEFNLSRWALVHGTAAFFARERVEDDGFVLGMQLPYHSRHEPWVAGPIFMNNLETHWKIAGTVGSYTVYERL